jgi:molybdenum cofactor synthesis domain-containing protein
MQAGIASVNIAPKKGEKKTPVSDAVLIAGYGVEGDAHAGGIHQVSLLAQESIHKGIASGVELRPGDFGENITTQGIPLTSLKVGDRLMAGGEVILQISQLGKTCNVPCSIGRRLGDCIMPREGVFAKVLRGGRIAPGDAIQPTSLKVGAVLTSSDRCSRGERQDESGRLLMELLDELGIVLADYTVLPDEEAELTEKLKSLADRCAVDIVLTTGGTGFTVRDRMPEATLAVIESPANGISEAIRHEGLQHTPYACLSRGVSGLRGRTLIINLPGSKRAISESLDLLRTIIPHIMEVMRSEVTDCGMIPRP